MVKIVIEYKGFSKKSDKDKQMIELPSSSNQQHSQSLRITGEELAQVINLAIPDASRASVCQAVYTLLPNMSSILVDDYDCGEYASPTLSEEYGFFIKLKTFPNTFKEWVRQTFKEDLNSPYSNMGGVISEWVQSDPPFAAGIFDLYTDQVLEILEETDLLTSSLFNGRACIVGIKTNLLDVAISLIASTIVDEEDYDDEEDSDEEANKSLYNATMALYYDEY